MRTNKIQPIGRFYMVEVQGREGSYMVESDNLPRGRNLSPKDGLAFLRQQDDALAVFEVIIAEGYVRDVSEDMARAWLAEFGGERDAIPAFIALHLDDDDIEAHYEDQSFWVRHERELARVSL